MVDISNLFRYLFLPYTFRITYKNYIYYYAITPIQIILLINYYLNQ